MRIKEAATLHLMSDLDGIQFHAPPSTGTIKSLILGHLHIPSPDDELKFFSFPEKFFPALLAVGQANINIL